MKKNDDIKSCIMVGEAFGNKIEVLEGNFFLGMYVSIKASKKVLHSLYSKALCFLSRQTSGKGETGMAEGRLDCGAAGRSGDAARLIQSRGREPGHRGQGLDYGTSSQRDRRERVLGCHRNSGILFYTSSSYTMTFT